ncbi:unnamed protein product [Parnassius mnemosyne]|uniref:Uncharacterized protein n=1 Tax=Parnassius mnemosyne TaxID=213953 RepID=A0AAV1KWP2_9NEOP
MADESLASNRDVISNEEILTKEFLLIEKSCESYKDSDEELKNIFKEIKKLSCAKNKDSEVGEDSEDVELILKRAEDIANETENLLNSSPVVGFRNCVSPCVESKVPQIKVTKVSENETRLDNKVAGSLKVEYTLFYTFV